MGKDGRMTTVMVGAGGSVHEGGDEGDGSDDEGSSRPGSRATGSVVVSRAGPGAMQVCAHLRPCHRPQHDCAVNVIAVHPRLVCLTAMSMRMAFWLFLFVCLFVLLLHSTR